MSDTKFSRQLSLDLKQINPFKSRQQVANEVPISPGQLSNIAHGKRKADKEMKRGIINSVDSFLLRLTASRAEFGIPSFMNDPKLRFNPFVTSFQQKKEESERQALENAYTEASSKVVSERTAEDWAVMDDYFRNYFEEIGSEERDIEAKREDAEFPKEKFDQIIQKYNREYGG